MSEDIQMNEAPILDDSKIAVQETTEQPKHDTVSVEDLQAKVSKLDDFAKKNRDENAEYRKKNRELRKQLDEFQKTSNSTKQKALEEQGHYKELYEAKAKELEEVNALKEQVFMQAKGEKLVNQLTKIATEKGCTDMGLIINLANTKYQNMIEFNKEDLSADSKSLEDVIEKAKMDHPTLFKSGPLGIKGSTPSKVVAQETDWTKRTKLEKIEMLREMATKNLKLT